MSALFSNPIVVHASIFIAVSALVIAAAHVLLEMFDPRLSRRVRRLRATRTGGSNDPNGSDDETIASVPDGLREQLQAGLVPTKDEARAEIRLRLRRAGISSPSHMAAYYAARLVAMVVPPVVGLIVGIVGIVPLTTALLWGSLGGMLGIIIPSLWLGQRISARQHRMRCSLADFLDLFVSCVESGMTLQAMIALVSEELRGSHPELSDEFITCCRQIQLGESLEGATADLARRTGLDDLMTFHTFVQQTQQFGATLSTALRELSDGLRMQRELRAEEMAQKASVKILFPTLLFIFPAVFVVLAGPAVIQIQESMGKSSPQATANAN